MDTTTRTHKIAALLGALLILCTSAEAATSKPAGMSNAEYRALMLRSEALNRKYHLGRYRTVTQSMTAAANRALIARSEALNRKYHLGRYRTVPQGMTAAANRALIARSEAMNRKYHLGIYSRAPKGTKALMLRSEALNRKYHLGRYRTVPQGVTAAANRALIARSEGMNEKYRLGPSAPAQVVTAPDFSWSAFGIGAAAMLAFVLLASGAILGARHGWRTPRTPISS